AEGRRSVLRDVGARVELVVAERHLVGAVDVVVALEHPRLGGRFLLDVVERAGVVLEIRGQERAERGEIRAVDAGRVAADRRAAWIRREGRQRTRVVLLFVGAEREHLVLDDRAAGPHTGRVGGEDPRVDGQASRFGADVRLVALTAVDRGGEAVGATARDGVDAGAGEVALPHVVRRDADLHLLDRLERDRRDAGAIADAAGGDAEAERVVEVRPVHGHVVRAVILAGDRPVAAILRRQAG